MSCSFYLNGVDVISHPTCNLCTIDGETATCLDSSETSAFYFVDNLQYRYIQNQTTFGPFGFKGLYSFKGNCQCVGAYTLAISKDQVDEIGNTLVSNGYDCVQISDLVSDEIIRTYQKNPKEICQWSETPKKNPNTKILITYYTTMDDNAHPLKNPVTITIDNNDGSGYINTGSECGVTLDTMSTRLDKIFPEIPASDPGFYFGSQIGPKYYHVIDLNNFKKLVAAMKDVGQTLAFRLYESECPLIYRKSITLGIGKAMFKGKYFIQNGMIDVIGNNPRIVSALLDLSSLNISSSTRNREKLSNVMTTADTEGYTPVSSITQNALVQYLKDVQKANPQEKDILVTTEDGTLKITVPDLVVTPAKSTFLKTLKAATSLYICYKLLK